MSRLVLVRHGHVEGISPERFRGRRDVDLSELGVRQAHVLRLMRERHAGQTVVLVGHGAFNRALLLQLLDQPLSAYWRVGQDPGALSEIELLEYGATVHRLNESCS